MRKPITVLLVLGIAIALFLFFKRDSARDDQGSTANNVTSSTGARSTNGVSQSPGSAPTRATMQMNSSLAIVRAGFAAATDLMKFRESLETLPGVSVADKKFYSAAILEHCHVAGLGQGWQGWNKTNTRYDTSPEGSEIFRAQQASFSGTKPAPQPSKNDPQKFSREDAKKVLASRDAATLCAGYKNAPISDEAVLNAWKAAAATGDARSIAVLSDIEFNQLAKPIDWSRFGENRSGKPLPTALELPVPSPNHVAALTAAMSSGDPAAIVSFGPTFTQSYGGGEFLFGPGQEALSAGLRETLWGMLACDFGYPCSNTNNPTLLRVCEQTGLCDSPDLETYLRSYRLTPDEVAQYDRLRPLFVDALRTGNWSFMQFGNARAAPGSSIIQANGNPFRIPIRLGP
jgi:hypothetical protein